MNTWDDFIRELKRQFYLENPMREAMIHLQKLHQTGTIHDYVKEFTTLALEIPDLFDGDAFVYLVIGINGWTKKELKRRGVEHLATGT